MLLGHHRARGWAPCVIQRLPTSCLFHTRWYIYMSMLLFQFVALSHPPLCPQLRLLHLRFYSCPANRFISTIFLDSVQFSSVTQSCLTFCDPMDCSTPGFLVHHQLPELAQTHVHQVGDAIQPSHPLSYPSPPALSLSQNQSLFQWVSSSH